MTSAVSLRPHSGFAGDPDALRENLREVAAGDGDPAEASVAIANFPEGPPGNFKVRCAPDCRQKRQLFHAPPVRRKEKKRKRKEKEKEKKKKKKERKEQMKRKRKGRKCGRS